MLKFIKLSLKSLYKLNHKKMRIFTAKKHREDDLIRKKRIKIKTHRDDIWVNNQNYTDCLRPLKNQ